ncbi:MAG: ATP-binding protein [Aggregatilineales bacterium]
MKLNFVGWRSVAPTFLQEPYNISIRRPETPTIKWPRFPKSDEPDGLCEKKARSGAFSLRLKMGYPAPKIMKTDKLVIGNRYLLTEKLGEGGMGKVFRAVDRLTGKAIALKQVTTADSDTAATWPDDSTDMRLSLAREFQLLSSLRHPNIIGVLDYGFDDDKQPFFTMDLLEAAQTVVEAGQRQPIEIKVDLINQILQALTYLHRRGILHRDLKPNNILAANGQVKVLDFGLSLARGQTEVQEEIAGTLAYLPPEALLGKPLDETSDLYAVGIIIYEMLTGAHPFGSGNPNEMVQNILTSKPDLSRLQTGESEHASNAPTPGELVGVALYAEQRAALVMFVETILSKDPSARYSDSQTALQALNDAIGRPLPPEPVAIRESFLQAARLVGRDAELDNLISVLERALAGQGSLWLIGGESGVGKSRLLSEIQTRAMVRGAVVVRGQAISEGGAPYHPWRTVLRLPSLLVDLDDTQVALLARLVPDLPALLGRELIGVPELAPQAAQALQFETIEAVFQRQSQPIIILMEDLHWADNESLLLLNRIGKLAAQLKLLILGSYRDDERPTLPSTLDQAKLIRLNRLSEASIRELSEAMLGSAGRQPAVVDLLERETEGNVFFIVEVVRALAEEAGQLNKIGTVTIPQHVFAEGITRVIQRRLDHVPAPDYPLLQLAAVYGRQVDPVFLRTLQPGEGLDAWLTRCTATAVFEYNEGKWRFAHDKLRDGVLRTVPASERQGLHRRVAEALETIGGSVPEQAATLAYHFSQAEIWPKAVEYLDKAGDNAAHLYATTDARSYYLKALDALAKLPVTPERLRQRIAITLKEVAMAFTATRPEMTLALLIEIEPLANDLMSQPDATSADRRRYAQVQYWIGRTHYYLNAFAKAIGYFQRVLALADGDEELMALPSAVIGRALTIQGEFAKAGALLTQAKGLLEKIGHWPEWILTTAYLGEGMSVRGRHAEGLALLHEALQRSIAMNYTTGASGCLATECYLHYAANDGIEMEKTGEGVIATTEKSGDLLYRHFGYAFLSMAQSMNGKHSEAAASVRKSHEIAESLGGNLILSELFWAYEAEIAYNASRYNEALALVEKVMPLAQRLNSKTSFGILYRAWGLSLAYGKQRWDEAESHLKTAATVYEAGDARLLLAQTHVLWGGVCRNRGNKTEALTHFKLAATQYQDSNLAKNLAKVQHLIAELGL